MTLKAYPKINLYLKIIDFDDNFHLLESRFCRIKGNLYDEIQILESNNGKDIIEGDFGCEVGDSTVWRALHLLREKYPKHFPPVHIKVDKKIPKGSGLGGGSADAGCVLNGIDSMFCLGLSSEELNAVAKGVGADVAFFVSNAEIAEVKGIGEKISPIYTDNDENEFEIYTPNMFCDTRAVYKQYRQMAEKQILKLSQKNMFVDFSNQQILDIGEGLDFEALGLGGKATKSKQTSFACERFANIAMLNDLFAPACALYPQLLEVADSLGNGWFFSGSGSSFFRVKNAKIESSTRSNVESDLESNLKSNVKSNADSSEQTNIDSSATKSNQKPLESSKPKTLFD
ncbi:4-(cytidine 5'-diphospho)-2-C-methyl-D-erythritol kinase [Helicobacter sp. T3_23-1056]